MSETYELNKSVKQNRKLIKYLSVYPEYSPLSRDKSLRGQEVDCQQSECSCQSSPLPPPSVCPAAHVAVPVSPLTQLQNVAVLNTPAF